MNWIMIAKYVSIGLAFGALVGAFNYWMVASALKKAETLPPAKFKKMVMGRYLIRYFISILAMATFLIHWNNYILIGTAVGITLVGKGLAINLSLLQKGVK